MYGKCQDNNCDYPNESSKLTLYQGKWLCDGCLEANWDIEEFNEANRLDMIEAGYYS